MEQLVQGQGPTLLELLAAQPQVRDPQESLSQEELQERQFLERMRELARGLLGSEYWDFLSVAIIEELELAKAALENETISDKDFRIRQGEAKAYTVIYNKIVALGAEKPKENENGEAGN